MRRRLLSRRHHYSRNSFCCTHQGVGLLISLEPTRLFTQRALICLIQPDLATQAQVSGAISTRSRRRFECALCLTIARKVVRRLIKKTKCPRTMRCRLVPGLDALALHGLCRKHLLMRDQRRVGPAFRLIGMTDSSSAAIRYGPGLASHSKASQQADSVSNVFLGKGQT